MRAILRGMTVILGVSLVGFAGAAAAGSGATSGPAPPEAAPNDLEVSQAELFSLGCLAAAAGVGLATVALSGAALALARGPSAATVGVMAVPTLAAVMGAGCKIGLFAAPGVVWLARLGKVSPELP